jgi:histidinol-phosphatase (PHP family)
MLYKTDYHIHSNFSDGKAAPEEYLTAAVSAGISEIGFSEHLSLFRENQTWVMDPENTDEYVNYIDDLKNKSNRIIIKTGLEVDYFPGKEYEIESYFEHIIAAVASGLFDIIGHCDLIRIYGYKPSYDPEPLYRNLARAMKSF